MSTRLSKVSAVFAALLLVSTTIQAQAQSQVQGQNPLIVFSQSHPLIPAGAALLEMTLFESGRLHVVRPDYYLNPGEFDLLLTDTQMAEFMALAIQGRRGGSAVIDAPIPSLSISSRRQTVSRTSDATVSRFELFVVDPQAQQSVDGEPSPIRSEAPDSVIVESLPEQAAVSGNLSVQALATLETQLLQLFESTQEAP